MSYRKDELSSVKAWIGVGLIAINLSQANLEMKADVLDMTLASGRAQSSSAPYTTAIDAKTSAERLAQQYGMGEPDAIAHGEVLRNDPSPDVATTAKIQQMTEEQKRDEHLAHQLDGTDTAVDELLGKEATKEEVAERPENPNDQQVQDQKLAELKAVQGQERDSQEYLMGQKRGKLDERWAEAPAEVRQAHLDNFDTVAKQAADQLAAKHTAELENFKAPPTAPEALRPPVQPTPPPPTPQR